MLIGNGYAGREGTRLGRTAARSRATARRPLTNNQQSSITTLVYTLYAGPFIIYFIYLFIFKSSRHFTAPSAVTERYRNDRNDE